MAFEPPDFPGLSPSPPPPSGGTTGFLIAVPFLDTPPSAATDSNGAANTVVEGAAVNTLVGITAHSTGPRAQRRGSSRTTITAVPLSIPRVETGRLHL
jgi:hypothetical protein